MLAEKTLDDVAEMVMHKLLSRLEHELYDELSEFMNDRDIPSGDGAENEIEVEARARQKIHEMREVLGGTDG